MHTRTRETSRSVAGFALCLLAVPAGATDLFSCRHTAERTAGVDTAGAQRIEIAGRAGLLDLRPVKGTVLTGRGTACASSVEFLNETRIHAQREGDVVRLYVQVPEEMKGIGTIYATLDLTVDVPSALPIQVTDSSGDLTARDLHITHLTDSSGDILLRNLQGDIDIRDSSGDLQVENAEGRVRINDSSGDIHVGGAGDVEIPSDSSGSIVIERIAGSVRIDQDSSGDIRITGVGRDVEVMADSSGKVNVDDVKGTVRLP